MLSVEDTSSASYNVHRINILVQKFHLNLNKSYQSLSFIQLTCSLNSRASDIRTNKAHASVELYYSREDIHNLSTNCTTVEKTFTI